MIDNSDGFLDNLPPGPVKKRWANVFKETEEVILKRQLILAENRLKKHKKRLRVLAQPQDSSSDEALVFGEASESSSEFEEEDMQMDM